MELNFYSSRKERLSQASSATIKAYEKRNKLSFFKRNPHLKILAADLVLVLLFGIIIIPFFLKITKDIRFDDYKVKSKAIVFEDEILLTVKFTKLNKKISKRIATDTVKVIIVENELIIRSSSSDLPMEPRKDKYITFKLDDNKNMEIIKIRLSSGSFLKEYNVKIER